jgi:hypothetical protein
MMRSKKMQINMEDMRKEIKFLIPSFKNIWIITIKHLNTIFIKQFYQK